MAFGPVRKGAVGFALLRPEPGKIEVSHDAVLRDDPGDRRNRRFDVAGMRARVGDIAVGERQQDPAP